MAWCLALLTYLVVDMQAGGNGQGAEGKGGNGANNAVGAQGNETAGAGNQQVSREINGIQLTSRATLPKEGRRSRSYRLSWTPFRQSSMLSEEPRELKLRMDKLEMPPRRALRIPPQLPLPVRLQARPPATPLRLLRARLAQPTRPLLPTRLRLASRRAPK